jgi:hypothetical protein
MEVPAGPQFCKRCSPCLGGGCGVPQSSEGTLCQCNHGGYPNASIDLYYNIYNCLCGKDGLSGA